MRVRVWRGGGPGSPGRDAGRRGRNVVSKAKTGDDAKDALSWYDSTVVGLGMNNDAAGVDTLLFDRYKASASGCLLDTFAEGVTCSAANWQNWGDGVDGLAFQKMEKECPSFAAEYAALMIRVRCGTAGHYGPLRTKSAEVRPECDAMFQQVQGLVEQNPNVCAGL